MALVNSASSTSTHRPFSDPWSGQLALHTLPRTDTRPSLGKDHSGGYRRLADHTRYCRLSSVPSRVNVHSLIVMRPLCAIKCSSSISGGRVQICTARANVVGPTASWALSGQYKPVTKLLASLRPSFRHPIHSICPKSRGQCSSGWTLDVGCLTVDLEYVPSFQKANYHPIIPSYHSLWDTILKLESVQSSHLLLTPYTTGFCGYHTSPLIHIPKYPTRWGGEQGWKIQPQPPSRKEGKCVCVSVCSLDRT